VLSKKCMCWCFIHYLTCTFNLIYSLFSFKKGRYVARVTKELKNTAALPRLPERKRVLLNTYVPADRTMERTIFSVNKFHETICGHLRVGAMLNSLYSFQVTRKVTGEYGIGNKVWKLLNWVEKDGREWRERFQ